MDLGIVIILCLFVSNMVFGFLLQRSNDRMADRMLALLDAEAARTAGVMRVKPSKSTEPEAKTAVEDVPPPPLWTTDNGRDFPQG